MHFALIFTAVGALATGINAAAVPRNEYLADFRVFGETGCSAKNLGVWTVTDDDIVDGSGASKCNSFKSDTIKSVSLSNIVEGRTFYLYTDADCKSGEYEFKAEKDCASAQDEWRAWVLK